jgi:hypothetical protein
MEGETNSWSLHWEAALNAFVALSSGVGAVNGTDLYPNFELTRILHEGGPKTKVWLLQTIRYRMVTQFFKNTLCPIRFCTASGFTFRPSLCENSKSENPDDNLLAICQVLRLKDGF